MSEKTKVRVTGATILFPNIYRSRFLPWSSSQEKYGCAFSCDEEQSVALVRLGARLKTYQDESFFGCTSNYPPHIDVMGEASQFMVLAQAFQIGEARNVPKDVLVRGERAELLVELFEWNRDGQSGIGVGLLEVTLDAERLLAKAMERKPKAD